MVFDELAFLDLVHVLHQLIHEVAVMRDHEDGTGVVLQIIAEPHEGHEVEVVRRLIQQEQIRLHHQQPRHVRTHDPATAELAGGAVKVRVEVAEAFEDAFGFRLGLRVLEGIVLGMCLEVFRAGDIARGLVSAEFLL